MSIMSSRSLVPILALITTTSVPSPPPGGIFPGGGSTSALLSSCSSPTSVTLEGPQTFTTSQVFSDLDALTLRNLTFTDITGAALNISRVGTVTIEDCTFTNITGTSGGAAVITGRSNGSVTIHNVTIDNIVGHGIKFPDSADDDDANRTSHIEIENATISHVHRMEEAEGSGNAIQLSGADNVVVRDSHLNFVADWGMKLGVENAKAGLRLGENGHVLIENNEINDVMGDGILVLDGTYNISIIGNSIWNIATDGIGARPSNGDHGIYYQCNFNGLIADNHIWNNFDTVNGDPNLPNGLGISYRSGDTIITRNHIHNISKNGIAYWSDHPGSGTVLVESNLVYDTGMGAIYLGGAQGSGENPTRQEVDHHAIYNNTLYMNSSLGGWSNVAPIGWYNLSEPCSIEVYGNLMILDNGDVDPNHYLLNGSSAPSTAIPLDEWPGQEGQVLMQQNLKLPLDSPLDDVFTSVQQRNFSLAHTSLAIGLATVVDGIVTTDVGGNPRSIPTDAGAWEYQPEP